MRVFVAIFPPPDVRGALVDAARALPTDAFRLTAPERVHLTLRFLGEVPSGDLPRLTSALGPIGRHGCPFDAATSGFGAFPSARRARVLWAGIGEGSEKLEDLARAVGALLEPEGFEPEDKPFVPHLTLGRARRPVPFDPSDKALLPELRFPVRKIELVQSRHEASGLTYPSLAEYRL
ncbi:MAG TPA: RNA 2',3'-cyclic phosphodiesterase [Rubrobacter sp.]|nr:RNA 2',3'-cyclic phosphodiesterase [Rubrobacter sp.]